MSASDTHQTDQHPVSRWLCCTFDELCRVTFVEDCVVKIEQSTSTECTTNGSIQHVCRSIGKCFGCIYILIERKRHVAVREQIENTKISLFPILFSLMNNEKVYIFWTETWTNGIMTKCWDVPLISWWQLTRNEKIHGFVWLSCCWLFIQSIVLSSLNSNSSSSYQKREKLGFHLAFVLLALYSINNSYNKDRWLAWVRIRTAWVFGSLIGRCTWWIELVFWILVN